MINNCKQLKVEYEALQTHAAEFALVSGELRAEEKTGRALNREMFNAAKRAKKELAEARDILLGKLRYVRFSANYVGKNGAETIEMDLEKELALYREFYKRRKVDWIKLPDHVSVDAKTKKQMIKLIEATGMNWFAIIPDGLTGEPEYEEEEGVGDRRAALAMTGAALAMTGAALAKTGAALATTKVLKKPAEHAEELHRLMSEGYKDKTYYSGNYNDDGGIGASVDSRKGLRIVMARKAKEMTDDEQLNETMDKSIKDLEAEGGIFEKYGVGGMTEAEYLIFQRIYFEETNNHLDETRWTWLAASRRPRSGRVPFGDWSPASGRLHFDSGGPDHQDDVQGCRLAGSFLL